MKTIEGHTDYLRHILIHPTLPYIITCSDDTTIRVDYLIKDI
ncbi:MAG: WD40 repeat domain-containing protein [bacterium]